MNKHSIILVDHIVKQVEKEIDNEVFDSYQDQLDTAEYLQKRMNDFIEEFKRI